MMHQRDIVGIFSILLEAREPTRWEHEAFAQMLRSRFAKTSVAFIAKERMSEAEATRALGLLRSRLDEGQSWKDAYGAVSDEFPDKERRKREPQVPTTLVTYLFDGWISAHGFDFSNLSISSDVPSEHLAVVVNADLGSHLLRTEAGFYLYFVSQVYTPDA